MLDCCILKFCHTTPTILFRVKLRKPAASYKRISESVYFVVKFLDIVKKDPTATAKAVWKLLLERYDFCCILFHACPCLLKVQLDCFNSAPPCLSSLFLERLSLTLKLWMFCRDIDEKTVLEYLKKQSQLIEQYIASDPILISANVSPMLNCAVANLSEIMMSPIGSLIFRKITLIGLIMII